MRALQLLINNSGCGFHENWSSSISSRRPNRRNCIEF